MVPLPPQAEALVVRKDDDDGLSDVTLEVGHTPQTLEAALARARAMKAMEAMKAVKAAKCMTKAQLIKEIVSETGFKKKAVGKVLESLVQLATNELCALAAARRASCGVW